MKCIVLVTRKGCRQRMNIKELIKRLQCMDENHYVVVELSCNNCGCGNSNATIEDIQYKHGNCVIAVEG